MAESLRRLVNIGTFTVLQEKLERWLDNYYINTCDQNVTRCYEIIELNAKVQEQLFKLLQVTAESGTGFPMAIPFNMHQTSGAGSSGYPNYPASSGYSSSTGYPSQKPRSTNLFKAPSSNLPNPQCTSPETNKRTGFPMAIPFNMHQTSGAGSSGYPNYPASSGYSSSTGYPSQKPRSTNPFKAPSSNLPNPQYTSPETNKNSESTDQSREFLEMDAPYSAQDWTETPKLHTRYSAQDILLCDMCQTDALQSHCELCHLNFCIVCVGKHLSDSSKMHNVVPYIQKTPTPYYPKYPNHMQKN